MACRALSADHYAHAATRVMATMHAVGEAAGMASALAVARGEAPAALDGREIRARLAYLDSIS